MKELEMLKGFCSTDDTRFELLEPFTQGEHTYATDGRVVVRVAAVEGASNEPRKADPGKLFMDRRGKESWPELKLPRGWQDIPELWEQCGECGGVGKGPEELRCEDCEGSGQERCGECGHDHDCDKCKGKGWLRGRPDAECEECDGRGMYAVVTPILGMPGDVGLSDLYLRKVCALPEVVLRHEPRDSMSAVYFQFSGGDGLLMPMRINEEKMKTARRQWDHEESPGQ